MQIISWLFVLYFASAGLLRPSAGQTSNVLIPFNLTLPDGVYNFASAATPPGRLLSMQIVITYRVPAGQSSYKSDMSLGLFSGICEMSWGGVTSHLPGVYMGSGFPDLSGSVSSGRLISTRTWAPPNAFAISSYANLTFRLAVNSANIMWVNGTANISINTSDTSGQCAYVSTRFSTSPQPSPSPSRSPSPLPASGSPSPASSSPSPASSSPSPVGSPSPVSDSPQPNSPLPTPSPAADSPNPSPAGSPDASPLGSPTPSPAATSPNPSPAGSPSPSPAASPDLSPATSPISPAAGSPNPSPAPDSPNAASPNPSPATSPDPSPATSPNPSPATSPNPSPATSPSPSPSTSPDPSPSTSPDPSPATSPNTSPATSPNPSTATSPNPSPATSPNPSPATSPNPSPATSPNPSPATSPNPSPATSPNPSPATSPNPSPDTSLSPSPTTGSPLPSATASASQSPPFSPSPSPSSPSPSPNSQLVPLADEAALTQALAGGGVVLGQDPATAQPSFNHTKIYMDGTASYGVYYAADSAFASPIPTPGGSLTVVDYGTGTQRMVVVVSTMDQSSQLLGAALRVPAAYPNSADVAFVSITRYDANNNVISDAVMTFEFETGVHNAVLYRYPSGSPTGTLVTATGGSVGPCTVPSPTCYRITSRTSTFVGLAGSQSPSPGATPAQGGSGSDTALYGLFGLLALPVIGLPLLGYLAVRYFATPEVPPPVYYYPQYYNGHSPVAPFPLPHNTPVGYTSAAFPASTPVARLPALYAPRAYAGHP